MRVVRHASSATTDMTPELEGRYLTWLHSKVVLEYMPSSDQSYYELLRILHAMEFTWKVVGDDNRAEYGLEVRRIFVKDTKSVVSDQWMSEPCSVLEMLIALSDLAEFESDTPRHIWFWRFMKNLGLSDLNDASNPDAYSDIEPIVDRFIEREYDANGNGGLFPLQDPHHDQRQVEIWYQLCAYLLEGGLI